MDHPTTSDGEPAAEVLRDADEHDLLVAFLAQRDEPCPACGYDLRMMRSSQCPECGVEIELRLHFRERGFRSWLASALLTAVGGGMSGFMTCFGLIAILASPYWNMSDWLILLTFMSHVAVAGGFLLLLVKRRRRLAARPPANLRWHVYAGIVIAVAPIFIILCAALGPGI